MRSVRITRELSLLSVLSPFPIHFEFILRIRACIGEFFDPVIGAGMSICLQSIPLT